MSRFATGALEIVGAGGYPAPQYAVQNAMRAYMNTPQFAQSVQRFAAGADPVSQPVSQPGGGLAYGGAPQVVDRPLTDMREFPLGFFQAGIGVSTGSIEVISRPQITFRGERLVIPATVGAVFSLLDIKVGNKSQLVNSTALPAAVFAENAIGIRLSLDTATVAQDIALSVQNTSQSSQTFQAALIGTAAQ